MDTGSFRIVAGPGFHLKVRPSAHPDDNSAVEQGKTETEGPQNRPSRFRAPAFHCWQGTGRLKCIGKLPKRDDNKYILIRVLFFRWGVDACFLGVLHSLHEFNGSAGRLLCNALVSFLSSA